MCEGHSCHGAGNPAKQRRNWAETGLELLLRHAEKKGGRLLSSECKGGAHKVEFECQKGHRWSALPSTILGTDGWCKKCHDERCRVVKPAASKGPRKYGSAMEALRAVVQGLGGACLFEVYPGPDVSARFRCAEGHEFSARCYMVKGKGEWCPVCRPKGKRRGEPLCDWLAWARAFAAALGGECLSEKLSKASDAALLRCPCGHEWSEAVSIIRAQGRWCRKCSGVEVPPCEKKGPLARIRSAARAASAFCLTQKHPGAGGELAFLCDCLSRWTQTVEATVKHGVSCPSCAGARLPGFEEPEAKTLRKRFRKVPDFVPVRGSSSILPPAADNPPAFR